MFDVNLYIETSHQNYPKKRDRYYLYELEYKCRNGGMYTKGHCGKGENVSRQGIALMGMVHAVRRIRMPSEIHVYTGCREICGTDWINRLYVWKGNGFLTTKREHPANYELWKELGELLENHFISVEKMEHSYRNWMMTEMERNGRKGISHKDYDGIPEEITGRGAGRMGMTMQEEMEYAKRESRSLDPDRGKWPRGMESLGAKIREINGRKYLCTYYRDDHADDEEFRYRYDSRPYQGPPEMGWGRR